MNNTIINMRNKAARCKFYIAYGSNLNKDQMALRCPTAKAVKTLELSGYRLMFRGGKNNAVATIEPKVGYSVPIAIWELEPSDELALDCYEGWPYLYRKEYLDGNLLGGLETAMVYIMNERGHPYGSPSSIYLNIIKEGYKDFGLNVQILRQAVEDSKKIGGEESDK